jgi:hypothetical protein
MAKGLVLVRNSTTRSLEGFDLLDPIWDHYRLGNLEWCFRMELAFIGGESWGTGSDKLGSD